VPGEGPADLPIALGLRLGSDVSQPTQTPPLLAGRASRPTRAALQCQASV
jgi:hypothetical protein